MGLRLSERQWIYWGQPFLILPLHFKVSDKIPSHFFGTRFGLDVIMVFCSVFRNAQNQFPNKKVKLTPDFIGGYSPGRIRVRETNGYATYLRLPAKAGTWAEALAVVHWIKLLVSSPLEGWEVWFAARQRFGQPEDCVAEFRSRTAFAPLHSSWPLSSGVAMLEQHQGTSSGMRVGSILFPYTFCTFPMNTTEMSGTQICSHSVGFCCFAPNRVQMAGKNPFRLSRTLHFRSVFLNVWLKQHFFFFLPKILPKEPL